MNTIIKIIKPSISTDIEGFGSTNDIIVAEVHAYREDSNSTERWKLKAVFLDASAFFRFRAIPGITIDNNYIIISNDERFNIISVEDVRRRNMYVEIIAKKEVTMNG